MDTTTVPEPTATRSTSPWVAMPVVIVHPAGDLDHPSASRYWTEAVAANVHGGGGERRGSSG